MLFCNSIFAVLSEEQIKPNLEIATTKAIEILTNKNLSDSNKMNGIFNIFDPFFDYEQMAKIALGKRYKTLNDEQKAKFNKAFESRLKASYIDKFSNRHKNTLISQI